MPVSRSSESRTALLVLSLVVLLLLAAFDLMRPRSLLKRAWWHVFPTTAPLERVLDDTGWTPPWAR